MGCRKLLVLFVACIVCQVNCTYDLVGFWGTVPKEPDLFKVCENSPYNKIVVGFIDFKKGIPTMFKNHCKGKTPNDVKCHKIAFGIERCHELNKQVLLGIGGPDSRASFKSKNEALRMASRTWKSFFGGVGPANERPFLGQNFDGINFFMDGNKNQYLEVFLQEFNRMRSKSSLVSVIITISPSCVMENGYFAPILTDSSMSSNIDEIYVRFTDKVCFLTSMQWQRNLKNWFNKISGSMSSLYYTVPAPLSPLQSKYADFIKTTTNPQLTSSYFRGFAVLDSSRDQGYYASHQLASSSDNTLPTTPFTTPTPAPFSSSAPEMTEAPPPKPPIATAAPPVPQPETPFPPMEEETTTTTTPAPVTGAPAPPSGGGDSTGGGGMAPGPVGPTGGDTGAGGMPAPAPGGIGNSIAEPFETSDVLSDAIEKDDAEDEQRDDEEIAEEQQQEEDSNFNDVEAIEPKQKQEQQEQQEDQEEDEQNEVKKQQQGRHQEEAAKTNKVDDENEKNEDEEPGIIEGGYITSEAKGKQPNPATKQKLAKQKQGPKKATTAAKQQQQSFGNVPTLKIGAQQKTGPPASGR